MDEFKYFLLNSHQIFTGLLVLAFSAFFLQDIREERSMSPVNRRYMAAFLLIFAAGVFGVFYPEWKVFGPFLSLEFTALMVFAVVHPRYAISVFVYLFLSRPWETIDDQMMSSMPRDIFYLSVLSIMGHKLIKGKFYFRFNPGTFLIAAFALWMFLSGFLSYHVSEALLFYEEIFSKGIIIFLLMQNCLDNPEDLKPVKAGFVLATIEKCFVSYYKSNLMDLPTVVIDANERLESVGILSNSNDIAAIFVLALPFAVYFVLGTKLRPFSWLAAVGLGLVITFLVWQSASRGALLGICSIIGVYALMKIKSKKVMTLAMIAAVGATLASFSLMSRDSEDLDGSTSNRILYWKAGLNMAIRNPLFGVGIGGFPKNLVAYAPDGNVGTEKEHMTAHSSWVLVLSEGGFPAILFFAGLWGYAIYCAWQMRHQYPEYLAGLTGYGVSISFLSHSYMLFPYIVLAIVITHYQILKGLSPLRSTHESSSLEFGPTASLHLPGLLPVSNPARGTHPQKS